MLKPEEVYEFICKGINRKYKIDEFETFFGKHKSDTTEDTVNIKKVKQKDSDGDIKRFAANFYKAPIVNYKGYVNGSKNLYSEIIAKTLVSEDLVKEWDKLKPVRPNHFDTDHTPTQNELSITNRKEEILAKLLFYQGEVKDLGYIFDYQTPLKKARSDSYGKIDLLGYNTDDKCYSVIELKYRPSGSDETLLRCVLEAYTYYKLLNLDQIVSTDSHEGISVLRNLKGYKHTKNAELVVLFDEKACTKNDSGYKTNLMLRLNPKDIANAVYPSKTVESQQHKECQELLTTDKRDSLRILCETILKQEPHLKQIRFVVLRADTDSKSSYPTNIKGWSRKLDRLYRAETLLTIPSKG